MPSIRTALEADEVLVGTFHDLIDPLVMELVGHAGFEFVILDHEQSMTDFQNLVNCMRGAEVAGAASLIRVAEPVGYTAERLLSAGADGLILSRAGSREQVEEFVAHTRFAPEGRRGSTYMRGDLWIPTVNGRARQLAANESVVSFAIIESLEGLENVDEIAQVEGLTGLIPGHGDLTLEMGADAWDAPEVLQAMDTIMAAARRHGKRLMVPCLTPEAARAAVDKGAQMIMMNHDTILIGSMYADLRQSMRPACPGRSGDLG